VATGTGYFHILYSF